MGSPFDFQYFRFGSGLTPNKNKLHTNQNSRAKANLEREFFGHVLSILKRMISVQAQGSLLTESIRTVFVL